MRRFYALFTLAVSALIISASYDASAQSVGIAGSVITPDAQSILDIRSTTKGALLPRMTTVERDAIAVANGLDKGLTIYNLTTGFYEYWDGAAWQQMPTVNSTASTLDEAYDGGGSGLGRAITADSGPVSITVGGSTTIGLTTTGNLQLATDNAWIGAGSTIERIIFDQTLSRIDLEAADITLTDGKWFGIDASNPNLLFQGGSTDRLNVNNASITIDDGKWFGIGSTVERIQFDATNGEINVLGADVGIGTTAPDNQSLLDIRSTAKGVLFPRLTTAQRDAIGQGNATDYGLWIYNTTDGNYNYWDGASWQTVPTLTQATDADWFQTLSTSVPTAITDWIYTEGHVGIGVGASSNPSAPLQVAASGAGNPDANSILAYNPTNASAQDAIITARVAGTSAGDPFFSMDVNGETGWSIGMDNSHTNRLKIANSWNNLSSGTKMTIMTDGNVGIGTDSPTSDLDVRGTSVSDGAVMQVANSDASHFLKSFAGKSTDPNPFIQWKSGDPLRFATDAGGWSEKMRIQSDGSVGIGTTAPVRNLQIADPAGASLLLMHSGGNVTAQGTMLGQLLFDSDDDSAPSSSDVDASAVIRGYVAEPSGHGNSNKGGDLAFLTKANGTLANAAATERMRITQNGNVGIGTTAPLAQLHTTGSIRFANFTNGFLQVNGSGDVSVASGSGLFTAGNGLIWSGSTLNSVWTQSGNNIYNNNTANVGIGTTGPAAKLDIRGTLAMNDNVLYPRTGGDNNHKIVWENAGYAGNRLRIHEYGEILFSTFGGDRMVIQDNGRVGIGTASPSNPLHVVAASASDFDVARFDGSNTIGAGLYINSTAAGGRGWDLISTANAAGEGAGKLLFKDGTGGNVRMTVESGGNVGIGTTAPGYKLHVNGNIYAASTIEAAANGTWYFRGGDDAELRDVNIANTLGVWGRVNPDRAGIQLGSDGSYIFGDNGNIGVGTTSPGAKLEVAGSNPEFMIRSSTADGGQIEWRDASSTRHWNIDQVPNGRLRFFTEANDNTAGAVRVTFLENGNVGIGTTAPLAQLHTTGSIRFANFTNGFLQVNGSGDVSVASGSGLFTAGNGLIWSGSTLNSVWTQSGNNIYNNNTANVGIGTASPSNPLHVVASSTSDFDVARFDGSNTIGAGLYINSTAAGGRGWDLISTANAAGEGAGKLLFKDGTGGNVRMTVESGGNVGIGTTAPGYKLHVNGNIYAASTIEAAANGTWYFRGGDDAELRDVNIANTLGVWGRVNPDRAGIQLGSDGSYIFGDNGNIGVGTTTPSAKLDVNGNTKTSQLQVGSGTTMSKIQSGTATLGSGSNVAVYTVTFPASFSSAPKVLCTVRTQTGATYTDTFAVTTKSITTTNFQVNIVRVDAGGTNWGQTLLLDWMAVQ